MASPTASSPCWLALFAGSAAWHRPEVIRLIVQMYLVQWNQRASEIEEGAYPEDLNASNDD